MIDLIWQTDELRRQRPEPIDEARLVIYYFDEIFRDVAGEVLDELAHQLGRLGLDPSPEDRPLHFGTWVGGDRDGNPNVTAPVTMQVLAVQHDHALRETIGAVEALATDLSPSERIVPVSDDLVASLPRDARHLPATYQVFSDLSAGEAYRQKSGLHPPAAGTTPAPAVRGHRPSTGPGLPRGRRAARRPDDDAPLPARPPRRADRATAGSTG